MDSIKQTIPELRQSVQSAESAYSPKQKVVANHKKTDKKPTNEIPAEFPLIIHGKGTDDKGLLETTPSNNTKKRDFDENYQPIPECFLNKDTNFDTRNDLYACGIGLNPTLKTGLERERTSSSVIHFTSNQALREKTLSPKSCYISPTESTFKSKTLIYPDPMQYAPSSFQHRILELSAFESETIKWERLRKKKSK
ncbi:DgyrCDS1653 [Dimorphilus gyrociliatus]|uniref:DgyrCDS1653 n=1 Tax=Dimorphilus gyrociliatus TaxID=2664684 RepID=A0A7I8VB60_9ANNE|nr:DgyrCDS1653 [Dimorphilus gyrociliatus]